MPKLEKQGWSLTQIHDAVNGVMSKWNDQKKYETFGQFFNDLLKANDNMSARELALALTKKLPRKYGHSTPQNLRDGTAQPTYQFIIDLLDTNVLNLDPHRIQPARDGRPAGDQRIALFTKAELIEVTPESIQEFNLDVMAGVQDHL